MANCRALYWWSDEKLTQCGQILTERVGSMLLDWGSTDAPLISFECTLLQDVSVRSFDHSTYQIPEGYAHRGVWVQDESGITDLIKRLVFGGRQTPESSATIAGLLIPQIRNQLWDALLTGTEPTENPEQDFLSGTVNQVWSGFVLVKSAFLNVSLVLSPTAFVQILGTLPVMHKIQPPVETIGSAIHKQPLSFNISLNSQEIDLHALKNLKENDVLLLPHSLNAPAKVSSTGHEVQFFAFLGQRHKHLAIEVLKTDPSH